MRKRTTFFVLLVFVFTASGCFFPTSGNDITQGQSARRLSEIAAPLIGHMKVTVNNRELTLRNNSTQIIDEKLQATLVIVPLSKGSGNDSELPCVAGFLRVENLSDTVQFIDSGAQICYENPRIESQLEDLHMRVTTHDNQTCLSFDNMHEIAPRGEVGDFASLVWYVCQAEKDQ